MSNKPTYEELERQVQELITERKRAEEFKRTREVKFRDLFNKSASPLCLINKHTSKLKFNEKFGITFGYTKDEIPTVKKWWDLAYPDPVYQKEALDTCERVLNQAIEENADLEPTEYQITCKNGDVLDMVVLGSSIGNDWLLTFYDITVSKHVEEALRKSEEKYRAIMESFIDPLVICSPDFTVEYMNPAMIHMTGGDGTGKKCYSALHGLQSKCDWCLFDKVVSGEIIEADITRPLDGRNYHITHMPLQNQDKTISKISIYRDITDYLNALSEKEKAHAQLIQSQKMESIGSLAGGIAHDFNNILSAIIGFTELALQAAPEDSEQRDDLKEVYIAGNRAKELVRQILAFARQSEEETKPVRLSDIVTETLKLLRPSTPANIEIRTKINSTAKILGNASQLHQVIMNLCTNAIHSLQETGGVLEICLNNTHLADKPETHPSVLRGAEYVELMITDNGVGIDPAIVEKIFEPYFTTKGVGEGTGMGLAMVKGIVESYAGDIYVQSEPGEKTSFVIKLPIITGRSHDVVGQIDSYASGTEHILIIDDEPPIARMGRRMLESLGYKVTVRTSSIEALELFREKPDTFDLVITDMTMPSMTGDVLSMEIRRIRTNIPIILCTGYSGRINDKGAKQFGIKALVYKPLNKSEFAKTVRDVLDNNRVH